MRPHDGALGRFRQETRYPHQRSEGLRGSRGWLDGRETMEAKHEGEPMTTNKEFWDGYAKGLDDGKTLVADALRELLRAHWIPQPPEHGDWAGRTVAEERADTEPEPVREPVRLTRNPNNGGYEFTTPAGTVLMAWRNVAGFRGRQWELHRWNSVMHKWVVEFDNLPTRSSAVEFGLDSF